MRFLHCADLHLGRRPVGGQGDYSRKRYDDFFHAFDRTIQTAIHEKVTLLLVSGDLFDRRELGPKVLEATEKRLQRLKEKNIRVLITEGNHDNVSRGREEDSWLTYLEGKGHLKRLSCTNTDGAYNFDREVIDGVAFYGAGYPGAFIEETLTALAKQLDQEHLATRVVLVHTALSKGDFMPGTVEAEVIDQLADKTEYIAAGHFHSYRTYPKEAPFFFIPGAPEYWDLGEKGKRGSIIYDTDKKTHQFHPGEPRNRVYVKMTATSGSSEEFRRQFTESLAATPLIAGEDILVFDITVRTPPGQPLFIDTAWCENSAESAGALKSLIRIHNPEPTEGFEIETDRANLSTQAIEEQLIASWPVFGKANEDTAKNMQQLKQHQEDKNEELFFQSYDSMIMKILSNEKPTLTKEIKAGAPS